MGGGVLVIAGARLLYKIIVLCKPKSYTKEEFFMIQYRRLIPGDIPRLVSEIQNLYNQLTDARPHIRQEQMRVALENTNAHILGAFDEGVLVGMASLYVTPMLARSIGFVEDVVVDKDHRGCGIGKELMNQLIEIAGSHDCESCDLTTQEFRERANKLYQSLGFFKKETNAYRLNLELF